MNFNWHQLPGEESFRKREPFRWGGLAYAEEMSRLNHDRRAQAETDKKAVQKINPAIAGILAATEGGMYHPAMKATQNPR